MSSKRSSTTTTTNRSKKPSSLLQFAPTTTSKSSLVSPPTNPKPTPTPPSTRTLTEQRRIEQRENNEYFEQKGFPLGRNYQNIVNYELKQNRSDNDVFDLQYNANQIAPKIPALFGFTSYLYSKIRDKFPSDKNDIKHQLKSHIIVQCWKNLTSDEQLCWRNDPRANKPMSDQQSINDIRQQNNIQHDEQQHNEKKLHNEKKNQNTTTNTTRPTTQQQPIIQRTNDESDNEGYYDPRPKNPIYQKPIPNTTTNQNQQSNINQQQQYNINQDENNYHDDYYNTSLNTNQHSNQPHSTTQHLHHNQNQNPNIHYDDQQQQQQPQYHHQQQRHYQPSHNTTYHPFNTTTDVFNELMLSPRTKGYLYGQHHEDEKIRYERRIRDLEAELIETKLYCTDLITTKQKTDIEYQHGIKYLKEEYQQLNDEHEGVKRKFIRILELYEDLIAKVEFERDLVSKLTTINTQINNELTTLQYQQQNNIHLQLMLVDDISTLLHYQHDLITGLQSYKVLGSLFSFFMNCTVKPIVIFSTNDSNHNPKNIKHMLKNSIPDANIHYNPNKNNNINNNNVNGNGNGNMSNMNNNKNGHITLKNGQSVPNLIDTDHQHNNQQGNNDINNYDNAQIPILKELSTKYQQLTTPQSIFHIIGAEIEISNPNLNRSIKFRLSREEYTLLQQPNQNQHYQNQHLNSNGNMNNQNNDDDDIVPSKVVTQFLSSIYPPEPTLPILKSLQLHNNTNLDDVDEDHTPIDNIILNQPQSLSIINKSN